MSNRIFSSHSGQTLVDLVVALALLSSSVASAGVLSTTSSRSSDEAGRRTQATALADREMEGLRSLRDQTEHAADGWAAMPPFDATGCTQVKLIQVGTGWKTSAAATGPEAYVSADFLPVSTNPDVTSFKRMVRLCPTNEYQQTNSSLTVAKSMPTPPATPHAYTVEVTVKWDESNGTRQVVLNSLLSDYLQ